MAKIRQPVDDGDGTVLSQILHLLLGIGADHDAIQITGQNARGILHGLAAADLQIVAA